MSWKCNSLSHHHRTPSSSTALGGSNSKVGFHGITVSCIPSHVLFVPRNPLLCPFPPQQTGVRPLPAPGAAYHLLQVSSCNTLCKGQRKYVNGTLTEQIRVQIIPQLSFCECLRTKTSLWSYCFWVDRGCRVHYRVETGISTKFRKPASGQICKGQSVGAMHLFIEFQVHSGVHLLGLYVIGFRLLFSVWSPALITLCFAFMWVHLSV